MHSTPPHEVKRPPDLTYTTNLPSPKIQPTPCTPCHKRSFPTGNLTNSNAPVGCAFCHFCFSSQVGKLLTLTTEHSAKHLTTLNETLASMGPASAALAHRESALLTALTMERDAVEKRARLALLETDVNKNSRKVSGPSAQWRV